MSQPMIHRNNGLLRHKCTCGAPAGIAGKCPECQKKLAGEHRGLTLAGAQPLVLQRQQDSLAKQKPNEPPPTLEQLRYQMLHMEGVTNLRMTGMGVPPKFGLMSTVPKSDPQINLHLPKMPKMKDEGAGDIWSLNYNFEVGPATVLGEQLRNGLQLTEIQKYIIEKFSPNPFAPSIESTPLGLTALNLAAKSLNFMPEFKSARDRQFKNIGIKSFTLIANPATSTIGIGLKFIIR